MATHRIVRHGGQQVRLKIRPEMTEEELDLREDACRLAIDRELGSKGRSDFIEGYVAGYWGHFGSRNLGRWFSEGWKYGKLAKNLEDAPNPTRTRTLTYEQVEKVVQAEFAKVAKREREEATKALQRPKRKLRV